MLGILLAAKIARSDNMPLLNGHISCAATEVYNSTAYNCVRCPVEDWINIDGICRPDENNIFWVEGANPSDPTSYVAACPDGTSTVGTTLICFTGEIADRFANYGNEMTQITYYDIQNSVGGDRMELSLQTTADFRDQLKWAMLIHDVDPTNVTATSMIGNACAVSSYNFREQAVACRYYQAHLSSGSASTLYDYRFWSANSLFLDYSSNPLDYILSETIVKHEFTFEDKMNFWLARFSRTGEFKGFSKLDFTFQKCLDDYEIINKWRDFGSNYESSCFIDISKMINEETTDLFEPFIEDFKNAKGTVIRPCPVFIKTYRGSEDSAVNRGTVQEQYRAVRRFFIMDNYTSDAESGVIQYLTNISIVVQKMEGDVLKIGPPLFQLDYAQVKRDQIKPEPNMIRIEEETLTHRRYNFEVMYTQDMKKFWDVVKIIFSIAISLSAVYAIFKVAVHARTYGQDGSNSATIIGCVGLFLDIVGSGLFLTAFAVGIYVFIAFKFSTVSSHLFLPPEEEINGTLVPILWVIFGLKLVGNALLLLLQASYNLFLVDWETPKKNDIPVSSWRRIMVANQWNRILTVRSYHVPFTLLAMVFLFQGFDLHLLAAPIPQMKLLDIGSESLILQFTTVSLIWLVLVLVEWVWCNFIYWRFLGDPYLNFIDLCSTSNISVLLRMSSFHGYYIHGKSATGSSDQPMDRLRNQLEQERAGVLPNRGLGGGNDDQVFQAYLGQNMRASFNELYNSMLAQTGAPSVFSSTLHRAGDIPKAAFSTYEQLNTFLKSFIEKSSAHVYAIQQASFIQEMLDLAPTVLYDSVLTMVSPRGFKNALLGGLEWRLQLLYLIVYTCVLSLSSEPCIAALVVYVLDLAIVKLYTTFGRGNLSRKSLLDDRFFL